MQPGRGAEFLAVFQCNTCVQTVVGRRFLCTGLPLLYRYNLVGPQTRECGCNAEVSATCGDMVALCLAKLVSKGHTRVQINSHSQWPECRYLGIISFLKLKISPQHIRPRLKYQMISLLHHVCFNIIWSNHVWFMIFYFSVFDQYFLKDGQGMATRTAVKRPLGLEMRKLY